MSNTEQKQKILLKRTTEVNKPSIPSGASHGELFLNIASGANAHNKISTMQIGTNEPIIWSDDVANEKKFASKTEVEALVKEVEDNELVTATAISTMNASAGFNEDGSSVLEGGVSLSQAIIDLQARAGVIEESDPIFAKSAASGITSADITNWNNKMDAVDRISSAYTSYSADTSVSAKTSVSATTSLSATTSVSASTSVSAKTSVSATTSTKTIQDGDGNVITTTYSTKAELSGAVNDIIEEIIDNELVTSTAISTMNASAGFNEDGSSVLEGGVSLSEAIIELQNKSQDQDSYYFYLNESGELASDTISDEEIEKLKNSKNIYVIDNNNGIVINCNYIVTAYDEIGVYGSVSTTWVDNTLKTMTVGIAISPTENKVTLDFKYFNITSSYLLNVEFDGTTGVIANKYISLSEIEKIRKADVVLVKTDWLEEGERTFSCSKNDANDSLIILVGSQVYGHDGFWTNTSDILSLTILIDTTSNTYSGQIYNIVTGEHSKLADSATTSISATTAVSASTSDKAYKDGSGNVISSTYASKDELENYVPSYKTSFVDVDGEWSPEESDITITSEFVWPGASSDVWSQSTIYLGGDENGRLIELTASDENADGIAYSQNLTISALDGVKVNGSDVITKNNASANGVLVVDANGIANKDEITIGTFEIKNDKPYSYTLEGEFYPYDPDAVGGFKVTAQYDGEGVKYGHVIDGDNVFVENGENWYYDFIIADISFEGLDLDDESNGDQMKEHTLEVFLNRRIPILAAYIDNEYTVNGINTVSFTDDVSEEIDTLYTSDNYIKNAIVTRSAPYSLKHTSKALLNGVPVATIDMISDAVKVDSTLSTTSVNPVQNKVITNKIDEIRKHKHGRIILSGDASGEVVIQSGITDNVLNVTVKDDSHQHTRFANMVHFDNDIHLCNNGGSMGGTIYFGDDVDGDDGTRYTYITEGSDDRLDFVSRDGFAFRQYDDYEAFVSIKKSHESEEIHMAFNKTLSEEESYASSEIVWRGGDDSGEEIEISSNLIRLATPTINLNNNSTFKSYGDIKFNVNRLLCNNKEVAVKNDIYNVINFRGVIDEYPWEDEFVNNNYNIRDVIAYTPVIEDSEGSNGSEGSADVLEKRDYELYIKIDNNIWAPLGGAGKNEGIEGLLDLIEENEFVTSNALNRITASAGFNVNGESTLPNRQSLTEAIVELQNAVGTGPNAGGGSSLNLVANTGSGKYYLLGQADTSSNAQGVYKNAKVYMNNGRLYSESDKTLKTHIDHVNGDPELIKQIPKVYYHWKDDETKETQMGTYAQDLEKVYPELVATGEDGIKAVAYDKLGVVALAGIDKLYEIVQQLQAKNEELEKRIKELENK